MFTTWRLAAKTKATDEVFNLASGTETNLLQLPASLASVVGHCGLVPEFAPERSINPVPRRKAERLPGFRATLPLEQGLADLVKGWRAERGSFPTVRRRPRDPDCDDTACRR